MVDIEKLKELLEGTGVPSVYGDFAKKPDTPYICYEITESRNFIADGIVYYRVDHLNVELYEKHLNLELEDKVEGALSSYAWNKTVEFLEEEKVYLTTYEMEG